MSLFKTRVEQRQFKDIGIWMLAGKRAAVPDVLHGVFFMDGNDAAEDCWTFQGVAWNADTRTAVLPMLAHLQWTYEDSTDGRRLLFITKFLCNRIEVKFEDETLKKATVTPIFWGFFRVPGWIRELVLIRAEDDTNGDTWTRRTTGLFRRKQVFGYTLRRILTGAGQPTPAFEDMLAKLPESCLVNVDRNSDL